MQRRIVSLTVFCLLLCWSLPASLEAQDASTHKSRAWAYGKKGEYDKVLAELNERFASIPMTPEPTTTAVSCGSRKGTTTRPWPITIRPCGSIPRTLSPAATGAFSAQERPIR